MSLALAVLVHLAFLALIVFGVSWQVKPTPPAVAEIWDSLPPMRKAPLAPVVDPTPPPPPPQMEEKKPEPSPAPPPEPVKQPVVEKAPPQPSQADIDLKAKREREEKARADQKLRDDRALADKKLNDAKALADKQKRDEAEKQQRESLRKDDERRKAESEQLRIEQEARQRAIDDKLKQEQAAAQAREAAVRSARVAAEKDYGAKIAALIRSRANIPDTVTGKPVVQIRLRLLVNGVVFDAQLVRPSGNRVYDEAVERAINGIQQWPLPNNPELLGTSRTLTLNIEHER